MKFNKILVAITLFTSIELFAAPLVIESQGSFAAGGSVIDAKESYDPYHPKAEAQTLHGDHAYASYEIPVDARQYPMVFLHGAGQFSKTWDTTPDGREGFKTIFLRRGFGVYMVDQPRRGGAGKSTESGEIKAVPDEGFWFGQFRMGLWPNFYRGSQFPQDPNSIDQFMRQMTPNTAPYNAKVNADALSAVLEKSGPAILITHSQGCGVGWLTGMQSENVRAIAAYEPGSGFPFPKGELPDPIKNSGFFGDAGGIEVSEEQFMKFTHYPIVIYYGDFIPKTQVKNPHTDYWRAAVMLAHDFADAVNRRGGDVTVIELPNVGIRGNSHFLFAEKNNVDVANLFSKWLHEKKLDRLTVK